MSELDTMLAGEESTGAVTTDEIILVVNEASRNIEYNSSLALGVEGDYKAERIYFKIPKTIFMDEDVDLTSKNVKIYVKFQNGNNETYMYECTDKAPLESEDYVKFSWLLTDKVTVMAGTVSFMVCVKNIETDADGVEKLVNEWHTNPFEGTISKGINVSSTTPEIITDTTTTAYYVTQKADAAYETSQQCEAAVTTLQTNVVSNTNRITSLENANYMTESDVNTAMQDCVQDVENLQIIVDNVSMFKLVERLNNKGNLISFDISNHINNHKELMLVIRVTANGSETKFGLSTSVDNDGDPYLKATTTGTEYYMIRMNKTDDNYIAWSSHLGFEWRSAAENDLKYIQCQGNNAEMTVVIYSR